MKRILSSILVLCLVLSLPLFASAEMSGDPVMEIKTPFMITNAGQGPGGKMGRLLVSRAGTLTEDSDYYYVDVPYAKDLEEREYGAIVIVIGSTDKGLGATGITLDQEVARVDELMAAVNHFAEAGGYDLVLDKSGMTMNAVPMVAYSNPALDVTDKLIEYLKATATASAAASTTTTATAE